jgi:uncharacterized membrane protein YhfC
VLTFSLIIQIAVLIATPVVVGFWLNRRWKVFWILFLAGALAFVVSWVVASFFPLGNVISLALSSVTQMGVLYLIYRFQLKTVRTEREAIMVGIGLGGIELILLGVVAFFTLLQMSPLRNTTDETLIRLAARIEGISDDEVEPSQIDDLRDLSDRYWNRPWYEPLIQLLQPFTLLPIQASLAAIVLGAVTRNDSRPLFGAMALYYLSRVIPAYAAFAAGIAAWLALSLLFGGMAIWFLNRLRPVIEHQNEMALNQRRKLEKRANRAQ